MEPPSSTPSVRLFKQCLIVLDDRQLSPKSLLHFLRSRSIIPEDVAESMAHIHLEFLCPATMSNVTQWLKTGRHLMLSTANSCTFLEQIYRVANWTGGKRSEANLSDPTALAHDMVGEKVQAALFQCGRNAEEGITTRESCTSCSSNPTELFIGAGEVVGDNFYSSVSDGLLSDRTEDAASLLWSERQSLRSHSWNTLPLYDEYGTDSDKSNGEDDMILPLNSREVNEKCRMASHKCNNHENLLRSLRPSSSGELAVTYPLIRRNRNVPKSCCSSVVAGVLSDKALSPHTTSNFNAVLTMTMDLAECRTCKLDKLQFKRRSCPLYSAT
eukprot:scaffold1510_cov176-Ochromonas_danica.AAC.1